MRWIARLRWQLARHPSMYWVVAGAAAAVASVSVAAAVRAADAERRSWGEAVTVWVTTAAVDRGSPIIAEARTLPLAAVPDDAVAAMPTGVARHRLADGEVVTGHAVASTDDPPAGWVVVAVPRTGTPTLVAGDDVTLVGNGTELCAGIVTASTSTADDIEVAVGPDCLAAVAAHLGAATLIVARDA